MILILSGLPASGKSTYAREWVAEDPDHRKRINWDDLRVKMFGCKGATYFSSPQRIVRQNEALIRATSERNTTQWLAADPYAHSVIIDNTNLTERHRGIWQEIGRNLGIPVEQQDIDTPIHECVQRDKFRKGDDRVGRAVIERMALTTGWIDWNDLDLKANHGKDVVIVDIDGTLSDATHRQHHIRGEEIIHKMDCTERDLTVGQKCGQCGRAPVKRWDKFHAEVDKDPPKPTIIRLVQQLQAFHHIIVVSGRSPDYGCGIKTEDWLDHNLGPIYTHLFMRAAGDTKPDYEHKQEILDLLPKHRIAFVLDDRDQVVRMWRQNGLTCLQVAEGTF